MAGKAEKQANVKFSYRKYYSFRNKINTNFAGRFFSDMQIDPVARALCYGDTQPAYVLSTEPLRIAAYSDEFDAVVVLDFPSEFVEKFNVTAGMKLTSSVTYFTDGRIPDDLFPGEDTTGRYSDFMPIIQLFLGKNDAKIMEKTSLFDDGEWKKVIDKSIEYRDSHPGMFRDGLSFFKKS